jgi:hypothetical protein
MASPTMPPTKLPAPYSFRVLAEYRARHRPGKAGRQQGDRDRVHADHAHLADQIAQMDAAAKRTNGLTEQHGHLAQVRQHPQQRAEGQAHRYSPGVLDGPPHVADGVFEAVGRFLFGVRRFRAERRAAITTARRAAADALGGVRGRRGRGGGTAGGTGRHQPSGVPDAACVRAERVDQTARDVAGAAIADGPLVQRNGRDDLGSGAGQKALVGRVHVIQRQVFLAHGHAEFAGQFHRGLPGDPLQAAGLTGAAWQ